MHPADVKALLQKRGYTLRSVAQALRPQVSESNVSAVVNGYGRSGRIARKISELTGVPVGQLFPDQYPKLELAELKAA